MFVLLYTCSDIARQYTGTIKHYYAGSVRGTKMQKDCITLGVCTNATGTDRLKLVVTHTAAKPRDFGNLWKPSDHVDYFNNRRA